MPIPILAGEDGSFPFLFRNPNQPTIKGVINTINIGLNDWNCSGAISFESLRELNFKTIITRPITTNSKPSPSFLPDPFEVNAAAPPNRTASIPCKPRISKSKAVKLPTILSV